MNYNKLHSWNIGKNEAIQIQNELSKRIILKNGFNHINTIAGCDVAYSSISDKAYAAICVFTFPGLSKIKEIVSDSEVLFPYIPGLLTFREGPALLKAFEMLKEKPELFIFNGQGIAHPRKFGLATHMGIILDVPSIGCAQRVLYGNYINPGSKKGSYSDICNRNDEVIGACLRTRDNIRPVFISQGHKIDLKTAVDIILKCTLKYKLPEPVRAAHILANSVKEQIKQIQYDR
jgi:deoxyribonuclease V